MPPFKPSEEEGLLALVAALRGGLDPTTGYGIYSDIMSEQAARIDERRARMSQLTDLITGSAAEGMSYRGARALADAYTGGSTVPPRIQDVLNAAYPTRTTMVPDAAAMQPSPAPASAPGAVSSGSPYAGYFAPPMGPPPMVEQTTRARTSPLAPAPTAQERLDTRAAQLSVANQGAEYQQNVSEMAIADLWTGLPTAIATEIGKGDIDPSSLYQKVAQVYPELVADDPQKVQVIIMGLLGQAPDAYEPAAPPVAGGPAPAGG